MNKTEFLNNLRAALSGIPQDDIEERVSFYGEMIDDRMEEGLTEEEAVGGVGSIDEIVAQTLSEVPLTKLVKEKVKPKRELRAWEIVLIILGFPLWFSLIVAAFSVVLSLYIVLWALLISLWAVMVSFAAVALAGIAAAVVLFIKGFIPHGIAVLGVAVMFVGFSIFLAIGCVAASKGVVRLTKKIFIGIKSLFIKKETAK